MNWRLHAEGELEALVGEPLPEGLQLRHWTAGPTTPTFLSTASQFTWAISGGAQARSLSKAGWSAASGSGAVVATRVAAEVIAYTSAATYRGVALVRPSGALWLSLEFADLAGNATPWSVTNGLTRAILPAVTVYDPGQLVLGQTRNLAATVQADAATAAISALVTRLVAASADAQTATSTPVVDVAGARNLTASVSADTVTAQAAVNALRALTASIAGDAATPQIAAAVLRELAASAAADAATSTPTVATTSASSNPGYVGAGDLTTVNDSTTTSLSCPVSASTQSGDLLIAVTTNETGDTTLPSGNGSSWTALASDGVYKLWWARATGNSSVSVPVYLDDGEGGSAKKAARIFTFSGVVASGSPVDVSSGWTLSAANATKTGGSLTPSAGNDLLVFLCALNGANVTAPTGVGGSATDYQTGGNSANGSIFMAYSLDVGVAGAKSAPTLTTGSTTTQMKMYTLYLKKN